MARENLDNAKVAALLDEAAALLEITGADFFRYRAYQKAARAVEGSSRAVASMTEGELLEIKGVGKGLAAHITAIAASGTFPELEKLRAAVPKGVLELMKLQGVGPKKAKLLYEKLGVDSPEKLKEKAEKRELEKISGFGRKTEENLIAAVEDLKKTGGGKRLLYWDALKIAERMLGLVRDMGAANPVFAGSLRRGKETVGDIDILAVGRADGSLTGKFTRLPGVYKVLSAGPAKASALLNDGVQCDFRVFPEETFGAALNYFTGSKEHNVLLRERAIKMGLTLSEHGLCRASDREHKSPVAGRTEEEIYSALGLAYIPPELREARGELELAERRKLPRLVELSDIRGDVHAHTTHSDGTGSAADMLAAAEALGYDWFFLGDHSAPLSFVHGLDFAAYKKTREEVLKAARGLKLKAGRSIEMEIMKDGSLGYSDEELAGVDLVIGAVHTVFKMKEGEMTARLEKALSNPYLDAVAHLSGRLIGKRPPLDLDYEKVFAAALANGSAFEINGQPDRQDLADVHARRARELGLKLVLTTDAHAPAQLGYMPVAVKVARRSGLEKGDLLNSLSHRELLAWIKERRARALEARRRP